MISIKVVRDKTSAVATLRERDSSAVCTFCSFEVVLLREVKMPITNVISSFWDLSLICRLQLGCGVKADLVHQVIGHYSEG